jgi:cobalt/nickel transport system permease protein
MMRVIAATTFCAVLLVTTRWSNLLKAIRSLGAPAVLVSVLSLAFRYSVYFFRTALEMFEAAESRRVGPMSGASFRERLAAQLGVLTGKTATMSETVHMAMASRGFRGEVRTFDEFAMKAGDWLGVAFVVSVAVALVAVGR